MSCFHSSGRQDHDSGSRVQSFQLSEQDLPLRTKLRKAFGSGKRFIHSITDHHDLGGPQRQQGFHVVGIPFGPQPVSHLVSGPGEAAEMQRSVRVGQMDPSLQLTVFQKAFHQRIAVADHGVFGFERDLSRQRATGAQSPDQAQEQ